VSILTQLLTQFLLRLSFGLALAMAATSPRQVTSGYFRNHLYVLLGLAVLASTVALGSQGQFAVAPPLVAAVASYLGSVFWLYEKPRLGIVALLVVAGASLWGAWVDTVWPAAGQPLQFALAVLDPPTSGLVLGLTIAAMFLGHWYLNSPTMVLAPLERLIALVALAVCLRAGVEAIGLACALRVATSAATLPWAFISLRWLSGIFGALALAWMARATLRIPNTQSTTGILYVAVIVTFLGELAAMLLAQQATSL
jgi:hypothetical protein